MHAHHGILRWDTDNRFVGEGKSGREIGPRESRSRVAERGKRRGRGQLSEMTVGVDQPDWKGSLDL